MQKRIATVLVSHGAWGFKETGVVFTQETVLL